MNAQTQDRQNQRILDYALNNFAADTHEYGRADMAGQTANRRTGERIDPSRFNQDLDRDGRRGVDCSSLVYYALEGAGFDAGPRASDFTTSTLFNGATTTAYANRHFDVLPASSKTDGSLKPGDLLMMKMPGGGQHVAIFQGYDEQGRIQFFGAQTSTGPASVTMTGNNYWDQRTTYYGALRAKEEFLKPEFRSAAEPAEADARQAAAPASPLAERLVADSRGHVQQVAQKHRLSWDQGLENTVFALAAQARAGGLSSITHLHVDGGQIRMAEHDGMSIREVQADARAAANTPVEQSLQRLNQAPDKADAAEPANGAIAPVALTRA